MVASRAGVAERNTPACAGTTDAGTAAYYDRLEHPRVRGDDTRSRYSFSSRRGTPPRARGRRHLGMLLGLVEWNTPACAGTTCRGCPSGWGCPEHPRVRGDDALHVGGAIHAHGTPPRARGRPGVATGHPHTGRNTPACAGTTRRSAGGGGSRTEHPRVRGDDGMADYLLAGDGGTPPRARGRLEVTLEHMDGPRNTPACAGTTASAARSARSRWEHPRVRGDDNKIAVYLRWYQGTPPRARGRLRLELGHGVAERNTPACAGTTVSNRAGASGSGEHPRVRGDDQRGDLLAKVDRGTPPRARGRHNECGNARASVGNTPACAGTTGPSPSTPPRPWEHPRVRGDDKPPKPPVGWAAGTPPRARGRRTHPRSPGL